MKVTEVTKHEDAYECGNRNFSALSLSSPRSEESLFW
jgi:hypothetical protein